MIDRIEELLMEMAAEDEEEREDVPALPSVEEVVPASPRGGEGEAEDSGRTVGEIVPERPGLTAGETAAERARADGELWKDGPVWTVRSGQPEIDEAQRMAAAERAAQAEEALEPARDGDLGRAGSEWAARGGRRRFERVRFGLEGLYRQAVQGLRPAAPALPPEQAGKTARAQEPGSAASLAVDELDRAVRRDSRRYDGGMSIY